LLALTSAFLRMSCRIAFPSSLRQRVLEALLSLAITICGWLSRAAPSTVEPLRALPTTNTIPSRLVSCVMKLCAAIAVA